MDQPALSESRFAQFQFGYFLFTPYSRHIILTALVVVLGLLILGPGLLLAKYALCLSLAATGLQMFLAGVMATQSISRPASRVVMSTGRAPATNVFFMAPVGVDILAISAAVIGAIGCLLFSINLTAALCRCSTIVITSCNATTVNEFNELERRPYFFNDLTWQQLCFDDWAITIAWVVLGYATVLLDCVVIWHEGQLRALTERMYGTLKRNSPPAESYVDLPSVERGMEGADVLVARLTQRRFETRI